MATPTYDLLASTTLTSSSTSITFASIDQSYGDLILVVNVGAAVMRLNGDTGYYYPAVGMFGNGSTAASAVLNNTHFNSYYTSLPNGMSKFQIMDYSATDKHKSVLFEYSQGAVAIERYAGRFTRTAAITSLEIGIYTYPIGSTFNLYGVAK